MSNVSHGIPKDPASPRLSRMHKRALLATFCLAQFLDAYNITALLSALPSLMVSLKMSAAEASWIICGFTLTFASFLLLSGRISDVYDPKSTFIVGLGVLGLLSLGEGFVGNKVLLIVLRAISGIAASLTIPSALALLSRVFVEESEQARAIGIFGSCGATGDILGLLAGAVFVQFTGLDRGWRWVFWNLAMVAVPLAAISLFLIPRQTTPARIKPSLKSFDIIGVSTLTVSLILLIFAITSGSTSGWISIYVHLPLVLSMLLLGFFLCWEAVTPAEIAAIPSATWFYPNFAVLFAVALLPFFWWTAVFMAFNTLWQDVYGWSAVSSAVHLIPVGITSAIIGSAGSFSRMSLKHILVGAHALLLISTVLLAFSDSPDRYWTFVFPAFIVGSTGAMITFTHANIAIFKTAPCSMAGVVGAIFNGALQLGSAIGIAVFTAIQVRVDSKTGKADSYEGRAAGFWFMVIVICAEMMIILVFYKDEGTNAVTVEEKTFGA